MNKKITSLVLCGSLAVAACGASTPSAVNQDKAAAANTLDRLNSTQPVPSFAWSQIRQNLIEINEAQAATTATTSFFFNLGVKEPVFVCPSIGFPIASTTQLTNPFQVVGNANTGLATIGQIEQTGVYPGESTGTYVICMSGNSAFGYYHEGDVSTVAGPAEWTETGIKLIGEPSFEFTTGQN